MAKTEQSETKDGGIRLTPKPGTRISGVVTRLRYFAEKGCPDCGAPMILELRHVTNDEGVGAIRDQPKCGKCRHKKRAS